MKGGVEFKFDEDGSIALVNDIWKKKELNQSARNLLLFSDKIIETRREVVRWDAPKECNLFVTAPFGFNMRFLLRLFLEHKMKYESFAKLNGDIKGNALAVNIVSGSKRCSYCKGFQKFLDKRLSHQVFLVENSAGSGFLN